MTTVTGTRIPTLTAVEEEAPTTSAVEEEAPADPAAEQAAQGGNKGIQGPPTTTYPPMTATTYGYKNQNGDWVTTEWTQSYTTPAEATAAVPSGTIQDLQEYKDQQKGMTDKAVQPGSAKQGSSGAGRRAASGGAAALVAGVVYYAL